VGASKYSGYLGFSEAWTVSMRDERANPVRPIFANENLPAEEVEKEDNEVEDEAGVRVPVVKRGPKEPTEKEITAHNVTHVPFRSWCPHCVSAAAKATPHRSRKEESEPAVKNTISRSV
jgi:hypothetical protein